MQEKIVIKGAREHNLKNIDVEIPKNKLVVFTGVSGSGKSSLAMDTIYAEGQRRYVESLSAYARQFLGVMKKPDIDYIEGLSPAISIDQKSTTHNPRSTVGTVTEIYDYLRLLFSRIGTPHCPQCGRKIERLSKERIVDEILIKFQAATPKKILILAPIVKGKKGEFMELFKDLKKRGYQRVRIDSNIFSLDEDFVLIKTNKHNIDAVVDRLILQKKVDKQRLSDSVEQALALSGGEVIIGEIKDRGFSIPEKPKEVRDTFFSERFGCNNCGISIQAPEPRLFSFNSPYGACPTCNGLGILYAIDPNLVLSKELSIAEGGVFPWQDIATRDTWFSRTVRTALSEINIPLNIPIKNLSTPNREILLYGTGDKIYEVHGKNRFGEKTKILETFPGVINDLLLRHKETDSTIVRQEIEKFMMPKVCNTCQGTKLKKESLAITIGDKSIVDVTGLSIDKCSLFIGDLENRLSSREKDIGNIILKEIKSRLMFLLDVGLSYLTLSRNADTLAGGETQRIRLASQIGSGLSGVLYVLDEPTIGLHPRDDSKLIDTLFKLRSLGNTVIVVEHDRAMMEASDLILDFGPGAGDHGGKIVAIETPTELLENKNSLTGLYLSNKKTININRGNFDPSKVEQFLVLHKVEEHNLKKIDVSIPLRCFICITGVSGSGKSTLINDVLYHALMKKRNPFHKQNPGKFGQILGDEFLRRVFLIDQSPIGRTPRSNPVTYIGAFTFIREIFTNTREARLRGYLPGRFSFNVKGGRCETCEGEGQIKIEMQFLPDVYIECEACQGKRYTPQTLEVEFESKNISEILDMTVEDSLSFFSFHETLLHKLQTLYDVGLSYIKLGQPAPTLSGGEAQRVKLAAELSKKGGGESLYLLDEPTTGLHFADLEKLIVVLRRLVAMGNTVIVIEHNLDVIKNSDYIIDLGPEGGEEGGHIVAKGTPWEIANNPKSYTGTYLKKVL